MSPGEDSRLLAPQGGDTLLVLLSKGGGHDDTQVQEVNRRSQRVLRAIIDCGQNSLP